MMQKNAGIGATLLNFAKRNPGLVAGGIGGSVLGGIHGAQSAVDPMTGQPVGGGVTGALTGAMGGGLLGGGLGLGAQGAIRSGLGARKVMQEAAAAGSPVKGGYAGQLLDQAGRRAGLFAHDVGHVAHRAGAGMHDVGNWMKDTTRRRVAAMSDVMPQAAQAAAGA
jgi:hypothetical protein